MPHIFINRPRIYKLTRDRSDLKAQFRWETINAIRYKVGGIIFYHRQYSLFSPVLSLRGHRSLNLLCRVAALSYRYRS